MKKNKHGSLKYQHLLLLIFFAFFTVKVCATPATIDTDSTVPSECLTFECYLQRAEQGDARAQYEVGMAYYDGTDDVEDMDIRLGKAWLKKSAKQGYVKAQYELGNIYSYIDEQVAIDWYMQAAQSGNTQAMTALARVYDSAIDMDKDLEKSLYWYTLAAEHDDAQAQLKLAHLYYDGKVVQEDKEQAMQWYLKFLEKNRLEKWSYTGTFFVSECTDQEAWQWYLKAAEHESYYTPVIIGDMYNCARRGVKQDATAALQWYLKAAQAGNPVAQNKAGDFYRDGRGIVQNKAKAMQWYQQAAQQEDSDAKINIALLYLKGEGVEKNVQTAMEWLLSAAESKNSDAMLRLAFMYWQGIDVDKDQEKAAQWLIKAAKTGNSQAQYQLAIAYANGIGVEKNNQEALEWFLRSAYRDKNARQDILSTLTSSKNRPASMWIAWGPLIVLVSAWIIFIFLILHKKKKANRLLLQAQRKIKG